MTFMCDVNFPFISEQSHFPCFTKQIFNEMSNPDSQTFQIVLNRNFVTYLSLLGQCHMTAKLLNSH